MDIHSLIGPAVVAAVISSTIAIIGFVLNRSTTLKTHAEKLTFDRELAERKVAADIALAEKSSLSTRLLLSGGGAMKSLSKSLARHMKHAMP